jgi:hypothetical protein
MDFLADFFGSKTFVVLGGIIQCILWGLGLWARRRELQDILNRIRGGVRSATQGRGLTIPTILNPILNVALIILTLIMLAFLSLFYAASLTIMFMIALGILQSLGIPLATFLVDLGIAPLVGWAVILIGALLPIWLFFKSDRH